ncbi:helix-turn-helix transcriptional regulator [Candidatus Acetothermia bacterium]|nr:helix-turn-helix transcriptional regulator [Candidatus Acetothermia bacterium]MBI3643723.1 helix-turn-helix transcriptional regulator [Candidatus Acetothermia bacterium]
MAKDKKKIATHPETKGQDTYIVKSLDQAKLLADPLRLRILQAFVREPRTTKQVADSLGENASKLYRHVDALHQAGFLELKAEKRKRGTTERYLQAIAHQFVIDPTLFLAGPDLQKGVRGSNEMLDAIIELTRAELKKIPGHKAEEGLKPIVLRSQFRGSAAQIRKLRQGLMDWLTMCHDLAKARDASKSTHEKEYVVTVAFYPIVKE